MSERDERGEAERGFIVIDRRGQEKEPASEPASAEERPPSPDTANNTPERPLPGIDFSTFVLSLSTSALYHLGLVPDPETGKPGPVHRELARQTIDTLDLLREKTRGNLDAEEQKLLEGLLYELRMRFVEVGEPPSR